MGEEIHFTVQGGPQGAAGANGATGGARGASFAEREHPGLSRGVDHDHLLAQIAQGLLTAHARLDLMEERLKAVASQAVTRSLAPGVAALERTHDATCQVRTDLEKLEQNERTLLAALEQRLLAHGESQVQKTAQEMASQFTRAQEGMRANHGAVLHQFQEARVGVQRGIDLLRVEIRQAHEREAKLTHRTRWLTLGAMAIGFSAVPAAPYLARVMPDPMWLPFLYGGLLVLSVVLGMTAPK